VPEILLSSHGRYVFAQSGGGWELRERVDARRRARWAIGGALLGAGAVLWGRTQHPFAVALGSLGAVLIVSGVRTKGRRLLIRGGEMSWGYTGEEPLRSTPWPHSRIDSVVVERGSRLADPKLRRRQSVWSVRILARDGEVHPASFTFATEAGARALAEMLARQLGVSFGIAEAVSPDRAAVTPLRRRSALPRSQRTEPRPGRLDPR
jgi:hypothetical protein